MRLPTKAIEFDIKKVESFRGLGLRVGALITRKGFLQRALIKGLYNQKKVLGHTIYSNINKEPSNIV